MKKIAGIQTSIYFLAGILLIQFVKVDPPRDWRGWGNMISLAIAIVVAILVSYGLDSIKKAGSASLTPDTKPTDQAGQHSNEAGVAAIPPPGWAGSVPPPAPAPPGGYPTERTMSRRLADLTNALEQIEQSRESDFNTTTGMLSEIKDDLRVLSTQLADLAIRNPPA